VSKLADAAEHSRGDAAGFYIWLLGTCGGARAEASLLRVLGGSRRSLWMQAAASLSRAGTARVVPVLTRMVVHDGEPVRREGSAYALGYIDPGARAHTVIETLVGALRSADAARVRAQAAESLTQLLRFRQGRLRRQSSPS
jgi:HEAT repeat protein